MDNTTPIRRTGRERKILRTALGIKAKDIAAALGVSAPSISAAESDQCDSRVTKRILDMYDDHLDRRAAELSVKKIQPDS